MPSKRTRIQYLAVLLACLATAGLANASDRLNDTPMEDLRAQRLQSALFPGLEPIQQPRIWQAMLHGSPELQQLAATHGQHLRTALTCSPQPDCLIDAFRLSPDEITQIGNILGKTTPGHPLFADAWNRDAAAINRILAVYGEGAAPASPAIDALDQNTHDPNFIRLVQSLATLLTDQTDHSENFLKISTDMALQLLIAAGRDKAAAFPDLWRMENKPALDRAQHMRWAAFPYTAIIVPGQGPEDAATALAPLGRLRVALAARAFRAGKAPFIIVSGGAVHPAHTSFFEAQEMRKALTDDFSIPADRVIMEPFARHTTTNLRNAARILFRLEAPATQPSLVITDADQSSYIRGKAFSERCVATFGYLPGTITAQSDPTETGFTPAKASLAIDPADPQDP